jgi:ectoine hydroxylase-related dioxygenase (phytanoyl-CoA dioxygenase family)
MNDQEKRQYFEENGYLVLENVLSEAEVQTLRESVTALQGKAAHLTDSTDRFKLKLFGDGDDRVVQQVAEPHELGGEWMALARDPRILDTLELLIGSNILLYYSMMMMKPAKSGAPAPWHQDFSFFVHDQARLVACQVYLDDSTIENGCIHVVPGSHKLGLLNHYKDGVFTEVVQGDTSAYDEAAVALPVRAGSMAFWHCMTLHSSQPNRSENPRRAIVFEYKDPGARLLNGSFAAGEVRTTGTMLRGSDPRGELLSAV